MKHKSSMLYFFHPKQLEHHFLKLFVTKLIWKFIFVTHLIGNAPLVSIHVLQELPSYIPRIHVNT